MCHQHVAKTIDGHFHGLAVNTHYITLLVHQGACRDLYPLIYPKADGFDLHIFILIEEALDGADLLLADEGGFTVPINEIDDTGCHPDGCPVFIAHLDEYIGLK